MIVVGLTGGIGSGKTIVSTLFAEKGVPIIDADVIAKNLTQDEQVAAKCIIDHFSNSVLNTQKKIDRAKLRHIIFENEKEKKWLETLLHPLIRKEILDQLKLIDSPYCIVVIPLLFDSKDFPFLDYILVVDTPHLLQVQRIMSRDNLNESEAKKIIAAQIERDHRLTLADDVIVNDGLIEDLLPQVNTLHEKYLKLTT